MLWKGLRKCGPSSLAFIDVEAVLHEGGDVELFFSPSSTSDEVTGKGSVVASGSPATPVGGPETNPKIRGVNS